MRHARARVLRAIAARSPPPPPYSPLANNCSGKHSGMLAYCVQCGLPKETYLDYDHPLQQAIRRAVAHFTSTPEARSRRGHRRLLGAELRGAARTDWRSRFARLAARHDDARLRRARPQILADAMTAHPEMVSGEGRSDLALMRAGRGDWVAKIGAEGVQGDRPAQRGHRHRDQDRRRQQARAAAASWRRSWTSSDCSTTLRAPSFAGWFEPVDPQLPRNRSPEQSGPAVVLDKRLADATVPIRRRNNPASG